MGECNKCEKYGHRASGFWGNNNKVNDNRNDNNNYINSNSIDNATTVEKEVIERLIYGQRIMRKKMTSTASLWYTHPEDKYQNITRKKTSNNGWGEVVSDCT